MTDPNTHIEYSFADIERYLNGSMTAKEMHDMERAALQDPFLADAIEGYRGSDTNIAANHLNEIAAALQKEEPAKVIAMPKQERYRWLVAASLLALICTSIFLFTDTQNKSLAPLAANDIKTNSQTDSVFENLQPAAPKTDTGSAFLSNDLASAKQSEKQKAGRAITLQNKKPATLSGAIAEPAPAPAKAPQTRMVYAAPTASNKDETKQKQSSPIMTDSQKEMSSSAEVVTTRYKKQDTKTGYAWTTDKGKPFLLSDVEVINMGKKDKKKGDTSVVKPEGGWQSFQNYLFSRLSRQDSLKLTTDEWNSGDLELEFTVDNTGLPYDIKVLHTQDSTLSNKIVNAIQSGPKWMSSDSKEKRLRLRY